MIQAILLVEKFWFAFDNNWGYIWGNAGVTWTKAKQDALVKSFVTKYGVNWKTNAEAKKADKYYSAKDGAKWIGHTTADCSGLFYWAFKQLGGYMYHGSNTMYNKYCTSKGKLTKNGRTDGKELKPGTAVFTGNDSKHGHVGLYVGNNIVVEAAGTVAGVITTTITGGKWTYWGELKGVDYSNISDNLPAHIANTSTNTNTNTNTNTSNTNVKSAVVNAARVALRSAPSTTGTVLTRVNEGERVQVLDDTQWTKVTYQGKTGYMMTKFLNL